MVKVEWLKVADYDLIQIYNYIYENSIYYSIKTVNNIVNLVKHLEYSPYMGRKIPEFNEENKRELIYKSYRIMYKIEHNKVFIRRIWHSARKLPQQLIS